MNTFKIGAFYTANSAYQHFSNIYLEESCRRIGIEPIIKISHNFKDWHKNVAEKPKIILDILEKDLKEGECLVFLDVDSVLLEYPKLFEEIGEEYEIGYHLLDWKSWYNKPTSNKKELLTGTMFFRNTVKIKELCKEWYEEAKKTNIWEQLVLDNIIHKYHFKTYLLPLSYCYIASLPNGNKPNITPENIIISHQQVSRLVRKGRIKL